MVLSTYFTHYYADKIYSDYKKEKQNPFLSNIVFSECFLVLYSFYVSLINVYIKQMKWYSNNFHVIGSNSSKKWLLKTAIWLIILYTLYDTIILQFSMENVPVKECA